MIRIRSLMLIARSLVALAAACALSTVQAHAAETLRVGKAVPEAFSFTPLDVGIRKGIFTEKRPRHRRDRLRGRRQAAAGDGVEQHRHRHRLGAGPRLHRQRLAGQGRCRDGRPPASARHRGAARRAENRRRSQRQENQRLDRRLADLLAGERIRRAARAGARTASPSCRWAPCRAARRARRRHEIDGIIMDVSHRLRSGQRKATAAFWCAFAT